MGGSIHIGGDSAWVASYGSYDHVMDRVIAELPADMPDLHERIEVARSPNLRHLMLEDLPQTEYIAFVDAVGRAYEKVREAGPNRYGAHPEVYDSFLRDFGELVSLTRADPRYAHPR